MTIAASLAGLFPFTALSAFVGWLAGSRLSRHLIPYYARCYGISFDEIEPPPTGFESLLHFFVRDLKPELRPRGQGILSPVDGLLRSFGQCTDGSFENIKGRRYSLERLLGDPALAAHYRHCQFFNIYLSPADCHHVYAPLDGELVSSHEISGRLFPVNDWGCRLIPNLFCENKRLVMTYKTEAGLMTLVMVGATNVGRLVFRGEPSVEAGDKVATFYLGSSIVLLFEAGRVLPVEDLARSVPLKNGRGIAALAR